MSRMKILLGVRDKKMYTIPADDFKRLHIQGTLEYLMCDQEDFVRSRNTKWYLSAGEIVNQIGVGFLKYNGIVGARRKGGGKYDFRRQHYMANVVDLKPHK